MRCQGLCSNPALMRQIEILSDCLYFQSSTFWGSYSADAVESQLLRHHPHGLLADRTATQYDWQLAQSCLMSVCLSFRPSVYLWHYSSRGRCTALKVVAACSYLSVQKTKKAKENASVFFQTHTTTRALVFSALLTLLLRTWVNRRHGLWSPRLSGFSMSS